MDMVGTMGKDRNPGAEEGLEGARHEPRRACAKPHAFIAEIQHSHPDAIAYANTVRQEDSSSPLLA